MKKTILLLLISVFCFELKAQKDYENKEAVKSHKSFAVIIFQLKLQKNQKK